MNVESRFESILAARKRLKLKINNLMNVQSTLESVYQTAKELDEKICFTNDQIDKVSAKARSLEIAKSRVEECNRRVADALALQSCHSGLIAAMESENYEKAILHVHRFLSIDKEAIKGQIKDENESAATERTIKQLMDGKTKLHKVVHLRFDEAVEAQDATLVEHYFKMFAMLNKEEGIYKLACYLSSEIAAIGKAALARAKDGDVKKGSTTPYADALRDFLESTAKIIDVKQQLIETCFGSGYLLPFVEVLQKECDHHATAIVRSFQDSKRLVVIFRQVSEHLRNRVSSFEKIDLATLTPILTELTFLIARIEIYTGFLRRRITNDSELGYKNSDARKDQMNRLEVLVQSRGGLGHVMQDIISYYIVFEQYAMTEKLKKAIIMETRFDGSPTSSLVDDTFFVLHEGVICAISSSNVDAACAVINNVACLIEEEIAQSVTPQVAWPSGMLAEISQAYSLLQQGKGDLERIKSQFLVSMNNAEMSIQYVDRLVEAIREEANLTPSLIGEKQRTKLAACLSLMEASKDSLRRVLLKSRKQLHDAIKSKLEPVIEEIQNVNHDLTEDEYALYEFQESGWAAEILTEIDALLHAFRANLTEGNVEALIEDTANETAVLLEQTIGKLMFNRLGGLVLECELRKIIAYFSALSGWNVRERFARVLQIAAVLTVDKVSEVMELSGCFGRGSKGAELSSNEIRNILGLRVDFSREEVQALTL